MNSALRNRETGGAAMGVRRCEFIRTRLSALRRGRGEAHRDAEPLAVETFAQRTLRAVPFGNALDDSEPQTAPAHTRALGSVVGDRRRLAAVEPVEHSRALGRSDPWAVVAHGKRDAIAFRAHGNIYPPLRGRVTK